MNLDCGMLADAHQDVPLWCVRHTLVSIHVSHVCSLNVQKFTLTFPSKGRDQLLIKEPDSSSLAPGVHNPAGWIPGYLTIAGVFAIARAHWAEKIGRASCRERV